MHLIAQTRRLILLFALFSFLTIAQGGIPSILIHEVAWMGNRQSPSQQWLELYNNSEEPVLLEGWQLVSETSGWTLRLAGRIAPRQTLFLATGSAESIAGVPVQQRLPQPLQVEGEHLILRDPSGQVVDEVDRWHAGESRRFATMQRVHPYAAGTLTESWKTSTIRYDHGYGTPGFRRPSSASGQQLYRVLHDQNSINIFFNQSALTSLAFEGNEANHRVNLEDRIIERIRQAQHRIDIALYDLNLPDVVDALIDRAAEGVQVRLLIDSKSPSDGERDERYRMMRVYIERMKRGRDGIVGTADDIHVFANSPIFAAEDSRYRRQHGMPAQPEWDPVTLQLGSRQVTGHLLAEGALRSPGVYFAPGAQMHNKFVLIDDYRVLTGSMNFTETGIYGSRQDRLARRPNGNSNNLIDIHSPSLLRAYRQEFDLMWGSDRAQPQPEMAKFRSNKPRDQQPHQIELGDARVQVFFSPGYDVIPAITEYVRTSAQESIYFCIFAWSDSALENAIKEKYEGNPFDNQGERTGFRVKGVFERIFWNQWWSANLNMEGRVAPRVSDNNPNIRWRNKPPVLRDREIRKLHHKYMLIDADTAHNPTVITGSANWSRNANEINDENTLFIHDPLIANQYLQEFYARFVQAGGYVNGASAVAQK
jgi:phosphatidylserine/phosphatidylglycerophosphate/cardiolipin synthase-like enzyme